MLKEYDTKELVPEKLRESALELKSGKWAVDEPDPSLGEKGEKALQAMKDKARDEERLRKVAEKERDELKLAAEAKDKGITKEALDEIRAKEALARKPLEDENAALKAKLRKATLTDRLEAKLLKAGAMPDRVKKALKDLEGRVDLTDDGEDFVVKDANGKVTSETIDDFVSKTYKTESPFFYTGTNGSGSGAEGETGAGGTGYDPVKAGKAAAAEQKKSAAENSLAFK